MASPAHPYVLTWLLCQLRWAHQRLGKPLGARGLAWLEARGLDPQPAEPPATKPAAGASFAAAAAAAGAGPGFGAGAVQPMPNPWQGLAGMGIHVPAIFPKGGTLTMAGGRRMELAGGGKGSNGTLANMLGGVECGLQIGMALAKAAQDNQELRNQLAVMQAMQEHSGDSS